MLHDANRKFKRVAKLLLNDVVIENLRIVFKVDKTLGFTKPNTEIAVYNLNRSNRTLAIERGVDIELIVGYENNTSTLFSGQVSAGYSVKDNADIVTTIFASDLLDLTRKVVNFSIANPKSLIDVIKLIVKNAGYTIGELVLDDKNFVNSLTFSTSFSKAIDRLSRTGNFIWYVQNRQIYIYGTNKITSKRKFIFDKGSGLLTTPIQTNLGVDVQVLMEPSIQQFDTYEAIATEGVVIAQAGTRFGGENSRVLGTQRAIGVIHNGDTHTNKWVSNIRGQHLNAQ